MTTKAEVPAIPEDLKETYDFCAEHPHMPMMAMSTRKLIERIAKLEAELRERTEENERWRTWGVIEIAVRNPNVSSYMEHWERRALKAEAAAGRLITRYIRDDLQRLARKDIDELPAARAKGE